MYSSFFLQSRSSGGSGSRAFTGLSSTGINTITTGNSGATRDPGNNERGGESFTRWRDRQYYGPRRWLESALRESAWDKDTG